MAAALCAAAMFFAGRLGAAEPPLLIYFDDSTLTLQPRTINGAVYLPLREIVDRMGLPYTEVFARETFSVRAAGGPQVVLTRDARSISVDGRVNQLSSPILRESGEWLAPLDFLQLGLGRITGVEFRHRPGTRRIFAGRTKPPELAMGAQEQGAATRVTLRADAPIRLEMRREKNRVVFVVDRTLDPVRERLDVRGRLVTAVVFDDADGKAKVVVETTDAVADVRLTASEENRTYRIDFVRRTEITELPAPGPAPALPPLPKPLSAPLSAPQVPLAGLGAIDLRPPAPPARQRLIKVIVLDPGHGGIDNGAASGDVLEKSLTLAIARKMRSILETRLGSTVLLTRDADVALSSEARSVLANNSQASLFISLHIGQSLNKADFGAIYVMKDDFAAASAPVAGGNRLFIPWYLGYRSSLAASKGAARLLRDELELAIPAWKFPVRQGPLAVLASAAAPALVIEIGNLNDPLNAQTLVDPAFQAKVAEAAGIALERYAQLRQDGVY